LQACIFVIFAAFEYNLVIGWMLPAVGI